MFSRELLLSGGLSRILWLGFLWETRSADLAKSPKISMVSVDPVVVPSRIGFLILISASFNFATLLFLVPGALDDAPRNGATCNLKSHVPFGGDCCDSCDKSHFCQSHWLFSFVPHCLSPNQKFTCNWALNLCFSWAISVIRSLIISLSWVWAWALRFRGSDLAVMSVPNTGPSIPCGEITKVLQKIHLCMKEL